MPLSHEDAQRQMRGAVQSEEVKLDVGGAGPTPMPTEAELAQHIDPESAAREDQAQADLDIIMGLRQVAGADSVTWKIYRLADPTMHKPTGWLAEWPTALLTYPRLQKFFGAGTYRLRGIYPNGRYAAQRTLEIATDADPSVEASVSAAPQAPGQPFNVAEFFAAMESRESARRREDEERRERERKEQREEDQRRSSERLALIGAIAGPVATVIGAMVGNKGPDLTTLITALKPPDPITTIGALKALMPPPEKAGPDVLDRAMKLTDTLLERSAPAAGGSSGWDIVKEIVKALGPTVGGMIEKAAEAARAEAATRATQPLPLNSLPVGAPALPAPLPSLAPVVEPASAPSVTDSNGPVSASDEAMNLQLIKLLPWFTDQTERLLNAANQNADPREAAELFLDGLPDDADPNLFTQFLESPQWWDAFQQFDARVTPHAQWFATMHAALLQMVAQLKAEAAAEAARPIGASAQPARAPLQGVDRPPPPKPL